MDQELKFSLRWRKQWWTLTWTMSLSVITVLAIKIGILAYNADWSFGALKPHHVVVGIACIVAFFGSFSLCVALLMSLYRVTIVNNEIHGRSLWTLRKVRIQLHEIADYASKGISGLIVADQHKRMIYIPGSIEHYDDLLELIASYADSNRLKEDIN